MLGCAHASTTSHVLCCLYQWQTVNSTAPAAGIKLNLRRPAISGLASTQIPFQPAGRGQNADGRPECRRQANVVHTHAFIQKPCIRMLERVVGPYVQVKAFAQSRPPRGVCIPIVWGIPKIDKSKPVLRELPVELVG